MTALHDVSSPTLLAVGALAIIGVVTAQVFLSIERGPRRFLLVGMVILTLAPAPLLSDVWPPIGGLVGAAILLTVRSRWSWSLAGVVLGADALLFWLFSAGGGAELGGRVLVHLNVTLTLFVVVRLARLIHKTHDARLAAAHALVAVEKQRAVQWLHDALGFRLGELIAATRRMSAGTAIAHDDVRHVAQTARRAAETARRAVDERNRAQPQRSVVVEPESTNDYALAWAVSVMFTVIVGGVAAINLHWHGGSTWTAWAIVFAVALGAGLLHLYHGTPRPDGGIPRWWPWTLAAQAVIVVPGVWAGGISVLLPYATLVAGSAATRLRTPWLWLLPPVAFILGPVIAAGVAPRWNGWSSLHMIGGLGTSMIAMYALCHLPWIAGVLRQTRADFTRVAIVAERSKFARDVHDLLGLHLSAMAFNAELAARAMDQDDWTARARLDTVRLCAERALADLRSIHDDAGPTTAEREILDAASLLRAAGIQVAVDMPEAGTGRADRIAAIVVREASTNILRHAGGGSCRIRLRVGSAGDMELDVFNDGTGGIGSEPGSGSGLANLAARVEEVGGQLTTTRTEGTFRLTAQIPADSSAPTTDPVGAGRRGMTIIS